MWLGCQLLLAFVCMQHVSAATSLYTLDNLQSKLQASLAVSSAMKRLETRLQAMEENTQTVETNAQTLEKNIQAMEQSAQAMKVSAQAMEQKAVNVEKNIEEYRRVISSLARQVSVQQFYVEEQTRSTGGSGLKVTRLFMTGSRPYYNTYYSDDKVAAVHDHTNYDNLVGMGELIAVLNGVEFRTRHNDYKLRMPSKNSKTYGATETIPFPDVPPEVLAQPTVDKQIEEMKLWFKAWKDQDFTKRDYRKYFKPVLCYLEGMWTEAEGSSIDEPFKSDRHHIDAESFFDLQEKAKYSSGTGRKSISENYAFLPTTISRISDSGLPVYSQWNYDILCHPLKNDVPFNRIRLEDDLGPRLVLSKTLEEAKNERFARFSFWPDLGFSDSYSRTRDRHVSKLTGGYLDDLMAEIPGKDNYLGDIKDNTFNVTAMRYQYIYKKNNVPMNVAYYHRFYRLPNRDAMGTDVMFRSFSDANLYIAFNTRDKVTPYHVKKCKTNTKCSSTDAKKGTCQTKYCSTWSHRVSFAVPLELIYTTPLQKWNPYNITFYTHDHYPSVLRIKGGQRRNGRNTKDLAYVGSSSSIYYRTPSTFFSGNIKGRGSADTATPIVSVYDSANVMRRTRPSGIHILLPNIDGVGVLRTRYPIMPLHQEGNAVFKELTALKDVTLQSSLNSKFFHNRYQVVNDTRDEIFTFNVGIGKQHPIGAHYHTVDITASQIRYLKEKSNVNTVTVRTSTTASHSHLLKLTYRITHYPDKSLEYLFVVDCDKNGGRCKDGHAGWVISNESPDQFPPVYNN